MTLIVKILVALEASKSESFTFHYGFHTATAVQFI